ncbi:hypothetical protein [Dongia sp. agr-C8]
MSENDNERPSRGPTTEPPVVVPAAGAAVVLDEHRGMTAQKETDARRHQSGVQADQAAFRQALASLETQLFSGPAASWTEAADKAVYLLRLFAATGEAQDPRYKQLIAATLEDLQRLAGSTEKPAP